MKHLNLDPMLEKKKKEIMRQFREDESPRDDSHDSDRDNASDRDASHASDHDDKHNDADDNELHALVVAALKTVYDPEIPVNIYDLGLIYRVEIKDGFAAVDMTLTTPGCPVAQTFPGIVERAVKQVPGISGAAVELVWDPPWTQAQISEAARLELGLI